MKLAFSNIAFPTHDDPAVWKLLRQHGISGIEVAPTKVWPNWEGATRAAAQAYRARLEDEGFQVPSMQAVLFGKPDAKLFDAAGEVALERQLRLVATLAGGLGARAVVLGAPKQRDATGWEPQKALAHAAQRFREWGGFFADAGSCLCIEPNPRRYTCNFIYNAEQGAELVRRVNDSGFGLHLDAAGMFLEGDSLSALWPSVRSLVRHFHMSEPDLGDFQSPQVPHAENLKTLTEGGYSGWLSVEMREPKAPLAVCGPWHLLGEKAPLG